MFFFVCNHGTNKTRIYFSYWTEFPFCCHCCRRFAIVSYWLSFETHDDGKKIVMFSCCVLYLFVHGILDERFNEMNEWKEHIFASARQKGSFPSFFPSYWFDSIYFTIDNINFFSNKAKNLLKKFEFCVEYPDTVRDDTVILLCEHNKWSSDGRNKNKNENECYPHHFFRAMMVLIDRFFSCPSCLNSS